MAVPDPDRVVTSPLTWLRLLRDDPQIGHPHLSVLAMLAATVSGKTGRGFASYELLAQRAGTNTSTVKRALIVGRDTGYVFQVEKGRNTWDGPVASTYQLYRPTRNGSLETRCPTTAIHHATGL